MATDPNNPDPKDPVDPDPKDPQDPDPKDPDPKDPADPDPNDDPDWKSRSRSWERKAKAALKERDELRQAKADRDDQSKSEHDRALEKARQETEEKIRGEAQAELRTERLDSTVARLAAGRFADVDDALLRIQAAIRSGDLDEEEVFVDNKVQSDVVKTWLAKLLKEKPHLAGKASVNGDADAGKGRSGKDLDDMSIDDHLKSIQRTK